MLSLAVKPTLIAWREGRWGCDLIYSNTATVCVGAFAAALLGRPHVWHVHEFGPALGLRFLFGNKWSHRIMSRLSSLVIAPSQAVATDAGRWLRNAPLQVVYRSLHRTFRDNCCAASSNGRYRCVIVGAVAENKRQEDAVRAMLELRQRQIEAELLVIGEGDRDYEQRLKNLVAQNQLQDRVRFLGELNDPVPQLRAADAVLVCSRAEGFGRVTAEAMLAGKPVISADNTTTAELIHHGANGLLYQTADPQDLARKIACLYRHRDFAAQLRQNGQIWARRMFTRERYCDQLLPLLTDLLPAAGWQLQT